VFPDDVVSREWSVEIEDQDSVHGFVDIARFFLAGALAPFFNYTCAATLTFRNNALTSSTLSGGTFHRRRVNPRQWQCNFPYLPDDEVFGSVYEFIRFVGFDREVFIMPDPGNVAHAQARNF